MEEVAFFRLTITNSLSSQVSQKTFSSAVTVGYIKMNLELITGVSAKTMQLQLLSEEGVLLCSLLDDSATLGSHPVQNACILHAVETDQSREKGEFEDASQVPKYQLTDEEYAKRSDSLLAFKKRMKMGRFADEAASKGSAVGQEEEEAIPVGSRCKVTVPGAPERLGTIMFVGETHFKPGHWVGIRYDEPVGKNNGSIGSHRYFECPPLCGAFVKAKNVCVGDFPEETFSDDEL